MLNKMKNRQALALFPFFTFSSTIFDPFLGEPLLMAKRISLLLIIFGLFLSLVPITAFAGQVRILAPWGFFGHDLSQLQAGLAEIHLRLIPQEEEEAPLKVRVHTPGMRRFLSHHLRLYDAPDGDFVTNISPQMVTVMAQEGPWLQISTWQGPLWVHAAGVEVARGKDSGEIRVALTFDDGPVPYTLRLLEALAERGVPATFFVLGRQVSNYPYIAAQIVEDGHEIASHAYTHRSLSRLNAGAIRNELYRTNEAIYEATGVLPALFRPPYGAQNQTVRNVAGEFDFPLILWSVDTRDWESRNVNAILQHFVRDGQLQVVDGDIILLHDIHSTTIDATIYAIDLLLEAGVEFLTTSQLLALEHESLNPGQIYRRG